MATIEIDQRKINQWSRGSEKGLEKREEEGGVRKRQIENTDDLRVAKTFRGVDRLRDRRVGQETGTMLTSRR